MSPAPISFPVEGLSDGIVRLRLVCDADMAPVTEACADPEVARYTSVPSPYEERHARQWATETHANLASGTGLNTVIVEANGGELAGAVGIHGIDPEKGRCSAGYWVRAEMRSRGIASRALRLIARFAFEELALNRIEIWVEPENRSSCAVAERVGFHREGLLRSFMPIAGERRDMLMYSLLPGDLD